MWHLLDSIRTGKFSKTRLVANPKLHPTAVQSSFFQRIGTIGYQCKLVSPTMPKATQKFPCETCGEWTLMIMCPLLLCIGDWYDPDYPGARTLRRRRRNEWHRRRNAQR